MQRLNGRKFLKCALAACALAFASLHAGPATTGRVDVSRWRGFNLLEKFTARNQRPFEEDDFRWIRELGFNFVRLPLDYRCYTPDWRSLEFREDVLAEIDQAVEYGRKYGVHVCINLHRAPGFCINPPPEPADLWTDPEAQRVFIAHWEMFARRYKGLPSAELSFNLLNEPTRTSRENYLAVHRRAIEAIHRIDPARLVIVDGFEAGRHPCVEFLAYSNVVQATRGYHPGQISHYRASWVKGSDTWPTPTWPLLRLPGYLYGPVKPEFRSPMVLEGRFPAQARVSWVFTGLSGPVELRAQADDREIGRRRLDGAAEPMEWERDPGEKRWAIYRSRTGVVWSVTLPSVARRVSLDAVSGDWVLIREVRLQWPGAPQRSFGAIAEWGLTQGVWQVSQDGRILPPPRTEPDQPLKEYLRPWIDIAAQGEEVFVGEFGCYNKTPHDVALAWMRSWLELWKQAGFGWALWNFRGSFGVLDSGREDVQYEDWRGHKLDRKMLHLLQEYLPDR